jgi:hypothetical protein
MCVSRRIEKFSCAKRAAAMALDSILLGMDAGKVHEEPWHASEKVKAVILRASGEDARSTCPDHVGKIPAPAEKNLHSECLGRLMP